MTDPYRQIGEVYDLEHDQFDEDLPFVAGLAGGPVLDVGCGTGRIVRGLRTLGVEAAGIDRSETMLSIARRRDPAGSYLDGDVRDADFARRFDLAVFSLDGFAHLIETSDQLAALANVRKQLTSGGRVLIDLSSPDPATWIREDDLTILAWQQQFGEETVTKSYARRIDEYAQTQRLRIWYDRWLPGEPVRRFAADLTLRYFFPIELEHLLARAGFAIEALYGDYELSPADADSPRLIVLARPAGRRSV